MQTQPSSEHLGFVFLRVQQHVTDTSKAAVLPMTNWESVYQLGGSCCGWGPTSTRTPMWARWHKYMSILSDVWAERAHWSYWVHTQPPLHCNLNSAGSRCKPKPTEGTTESHELVWVAEVERSLALFAGVEAINIDWKRWSSRFIDTACWERGEDKADSTEMTSDGDTRAFNFEMALTKWGGSQRGDERSIWAMR